MNADVLTTGVADGIAVIRLGSAKRIYFDEEMGDALTEALDGFAGDVSVRVVVVTGGARFQTSGWPVTRAVYPITGIASALALFYA
jgi:enoyl-CoA hydratase/carnithine racemase